MFTALPTMQTKTLTLIKVGIGMLLLAVATWLVHDNGRDIERGECLERENKALADAREKLAQANARNMKLAAENLRLNDEVTTNAAKQMEAARVADAAMRRDPHGLRVPAETCRSAAGVPTATTRAEIDNDTGQPSGIRLPAGIEENLYQFAYRANQTRIKRDECREWAIGLAHQREEWERTQTERRMTDGDGERISNYGNDT